MDGYRADAQREFLNQYLKALPSLRAYLLSMVRDFHLTEDLLQEVALAAWAQFADYDPQRPFIAWVLRMARNKCIDHLRTRKIHPMLPPDVMEQLAEAAAAVDLEAGEREKVLMRCIEMLSEAVRKILRLRFERGLPSEEIAKEAGKSLAAIRKSLTRARAFLIHCTERALAEGSRP